MPNGQADPGTSTKRPVDSSPALDQVPQVYYRLKGMAEQLMSQERPNHTLQPTALVHEALLRIVNSQRGNAEMDTATLVAWSARAMRAVLVDHARRKAALKRIKDQDYDKQKISSIDLAMAQEILDVHRVLDRLTSLEPQWRTLVEIRFFGGCTEAETAQLLGKSLRTVQREWRIAKAWLKAELACERNES